jgi:hypothetical protein
MVLLHPKKRQLFVYNHPAHLLWRSLSSFYEICLPKILESRFGLPPETAERDGHAILLNWLDHGLAVAEERDCVNGAADPQLPSKAPAIIQDYEMAHYRFGRLVVGLSAESSIRQRIAPLLANLRVEAADPELVCSIAACAEGRYVLAIDGCVAIDDIEENIAVGAFLQTIIERLHPGVRFQAFMHAAAVAKNGSAVILPAPSGSGKSTLTAYLVALGYDYFSDDLVALSAEDDGVAPFPLPLSVKPGATHVLGRYYPTLHSSQPHAPQHLAFNTNYSAPFARTRAIVFPRYACDAPTCLEPLDVADAFTRLLADRIFFGYPIDLTAVRGFIGLLDRVQRYEMTYSDMEEAERCLSQLLTA